MPRRCRSSYTATATALDNDNYKLPAANTTSFTISATAMTVSATGYTGTYDGTAHGITVTGTVPSTGYTVTYSETQDGTYSATAPTYTNAGEYTVYYKVTAANYTEATGSAVVKIEPKEVGLTWTDTEFAYDGQQHVPTATATGLIAGDTVTVTVTGAASAIGTHTATASALSNSNYKLPAANTTSFTIVKGSQAAPTGVAATDETVSGKNDGTITGLTAGMQYSEDGQTWTTITADMLENGALTGVEPGTYYVRYGETENYNASPSVTVTVNASQNKLTVTFNMNGHGTAIAAQEVVYNGKATEPAAPSETGYTFGGWISFFTKFSYTSMSI